jgi:hypothetical protein
MSSAVCDLVKDTRALLTMCNESVGLVQIANVAVKVRQ